MKGAIIFFGKFFLFSTILFILWQPFAKEYFSFIFSAAKIFFEFTFYSQFATSIEAPKEAIAEAGALTCLIPFAAIILSTNRLKLKRMYSAVLAVSFILSISFAVMNQIYIGCFFAALSLFVLLYRGRESIKNLINILIIGFIILIALQIIATSIYIQTETIKSLLPVISAQGYDTAKLQADYDNSVFLLKFFKALQVLMPLILGAGFIYFTIMPRVKEDKNKEKGYIKFMKDMQ